MLQIELTPFPILYSERLLFRKICAADTAQVFKLRSDPVAMKYLDKAPLKDQEEALALINRILDDLTTNNGITWALALKEDPECLIGTIGFWKIMKEHHRAEVGYMLLPEYFNKGYMTEALNTVNAHAFNEMKLHSIEANINPDNAASAAILKKAGFVQEAYFKENFYFDGVFQDSAIYSLLANQPSIAPL
ncbi:MAG: N-acetyltransferase [Chitinophagaceae bacterium]|nr:MAG: N-acetyltransferase [Chitinophagaceae bacterium]